MVTAGLPDDKASARERRWPVGVAFLAAWLLPATTAQRTRHASLTQLWLVHFVSVLLTTSTVLFLLRWSELGGGVAVNVFVDAFERVLRGVSREFDRRPGEVVLWVVGIALTIELAALFVAILATPWGACDEGRRESYRNALRQVWLRTSHVLLIVVVFGTALVTLARLVASWQKKVPWYVEYGDSLLAFFGACLVLWFLWGLLRSVGARRDVIPIARPPTCEACGYNLTSIAMESRCPECGDAVLKSLGSDVRAGTAWQRRETIGWFAAWRQCAMLAVVNPGELGRQLRVTDPGTDHRRFFALHLPVVFLVGFSALFSFAWLAAPRDSLLRELPKFLMIMAVFGFLCVAGMVLFTLLGPIVIGPVERMRTLRNPLPAAMQMTCYLSTYLTLWAVFGGATGLAVYLANDVGVFRSLQELTGVFHETLLVLSWLVPNSAWGIWFFVLVYRGTAAAAYANR